MAASTTFFQAWSLGIGSESAASGFAVDTQSRSDVASLRHCVERPLEGCESRIHGAGLMSVGNQRRVS
ncbi:MAG: hypothetical protein KJO21_12590 [Verrucomicrobiae bacterium]|nr:hypothetical protein [Verrucomicrobiae bacterium]NNJ43564.1 hypothetical protein [Akkermansiaceae bacterium]